MTVAVLLPAVEGDNLKKKKKKKNLKSGTDSTVPNIAPL